MATITCLSNEVITFILENKSITFEDIVNFSSTCARFQQIMQLQSKKFWEKKFYQRCPTAKIKYKTKKLKKLLDNIDFKKRMKEGIECIKNLQFYVHLMSNDNLWDTEKEKLEYLLHSTAKKDSMIYYFVLDELNKIISAQFPRRLGSNLTTKYNFDLIFDCLRQYRFMYKRDKFIKKPKENQLFEQLFIIILQYFEPRIFYSIIKTWLDDIAKEVLTRISNKYPHYSLCSMFEQLSLFERDKNIDDNYWNPTEVTQIIPILQEFIFSDLEINKLPQLLITLDIEDKYKNNVPKWLQNNLLTIIYHSVARRIGIRCHLMPVNNRSYVKIIWKPKYNNEDLDNVHYFYLSMSSHPYPLNIVKGTCKYDQACRRWIILSMMTTILKELKYSNNIEYSFYILYQMLHRHFINITESIKVKSNIITREPARREEKIKFTIGTIVTHSSQKNMNHDGVIIGWHYNFERMDKKTIFRLGDECMFPHLFVPSISSSPNTVFSCFPRDSSDSSDSSTHTHTHTQSQPHYTILTENNKVCYVPQDSLSLCAPKWINNVEIGRYFCRFEGTHYVPNISLAKEYPNDIAVLLKTLSKQ